MVLHDLRRSSPTEGATLHLDLDGDDGRQVYIPPGVAHGFAARSALVLTYLVDRTYDPDDELSLAWDDPDVGADWGVDDPILSDRDRAAPRRTDLAPRDRPT